LGKRTSNIGLGRSSNIISSNITKNLDRNKNKSRLYGKKDHPFGNYPIFTKDSNSVGALAYLSSGLQKYEGSPISSQEWGCSFLINPRGPRLPVATAQ
jgi:hypothetical protein